MSYKGTCSFHEAEIFLENNDAGADAWLWKMKYLYLKSVEAKCWWLPRIDCSVPSVSHLKS